jgi:hypothetical protein
MPSGEPRRGTRRHRRPPRRRGIALAALKWIDELFASFMETDNAGGFRHPADD